MKVNDVLVDCVIITAFEGTSGLFLSGSKAPQPEGDSTVLDLRVNAHFGGLGLSLRNDGCEIMLAQVQGVCVCVCVCVWCVWCVWCVVWCVCVWCGVCVHVTSSIVL